MNAKIDRMEILRAALSSAKDAREALTLARELAAFVEDWPVVALQPESVEAPPSAKPGRIAMGATRERRKWTDEEKDRAARLLDDGASYSEVGRILGRSGRAIQDMRVDGRLPVKRHTLNQINQLSGAMSAIKRGRTLTDRVVSSLNGAKEMGR